MTRLEAFCCAVLLALLALLVITAPAQSDDPHSGQPDHCANAKNVPAAHKCECKKAPNSDGGGCDVEDKKCRVYCHKDKCFCTHPGCTS